MNYDRIFEIDLDTSFFYTDCPGRKLVVGIISLKNAIARLSKDEYYTFVTYKEGEELPEQYIPLSEFKSDDGTLFATVNPNTRFSYICVNGGIQRISRLPDLSSGSPNYLLGHGPNTVSLGDLVMKQYNDYNELKTHTDSSQKRRLNPEYAWPNSNYVVRVDDSGTDFVKYIGDDGQKYDTIEALEIANKRYFDFLNSSFSINEEKSIEAQQEKILSYIHERYRNYCKNSIQGYGYGSQETDKGQKR